MTVRSDNPALKTSTGNEPVEAVSLTEDEVKNLVKSILGMSKRPRNLGAIWCFFNAWNVGKGSYVPYNRLRELGFDHSHRDFYFNTFVKTFKQTDTNPIESIRGILSNDYTPGYRCRIIESWKPVAQQLFDKFVELNVTIPKSHWEKCRNKVEDVSKDLLPYLQPGHVTYYRNTSGSPFRLYHEVQNVKKEERNKMFSGCLDLDIVSCFGSIWWHDLEGKRLNLELLNPENSDALKTQLREWFPGKSDKQIKEKRSTLFSGRLTYPPKTPFDYLQKTIEEHVSDWTGNKYINHHKLYTQREQGLMNRIYATTQPILKIHDGAILNPDTKIDSDILSPHKIKTTIL